MKTFGLRGTYSRTEQDKPAPTKRPALQTKQKNSARGAPSTTVRGAAEETEPKVNSRIGETPNRTGIDPLRVLVWVAFAVILVLAWASILWFAGVG